MTLTKFIMKMSVFRKFSLAFVWTVVVALLTTPLGCSGESICEHETAMIERDLGGEENWQCQGDILDVNIHSEPAGHFYCNSKLHKPVYSCNDILYHEHPPTSGAYRPEAPKYGEYKYLPPQRWLHSLELGALAFLYHPCANPDQVASLKKLADSCLWQHVITPYPDLPEETPLAIVSWGCVYSMQWVNPPEAKLWIITHALKTNSSVASSNGPYQEGLLHLATKLSFTEVCPEHPHSVPVDNNNEDSNIDSDTVTDTPTSPCTLQALDGNSSGSAPACDGGHPTVVVILQRQHKALTALLVFLALILTAAALFLVWKLTCVWRRGRHKQTKYKSVSKFFPFSYGKDTGNTIIIPELGMPKSAAAERETLLNESDEDEL